MLSKGTSPTGKKIEKLSRYWALSVDIHHYISESVMKKFSSHGKKRDTVADGVNCTARMMTRLLGYNVWRTVGTLEILLDHKFGTQISHNSVLVRESKKLDEFLQLLNRMCLVDRDSTMRLWTLILAELPHHQLSNEDVDTKPVKCTGLATRLDSTNQCCDHYDEPHYRQLIVSVITMNPCLLPFFYQPPADGLKFHEMIDNGIVRGDYGAIVIMETNDSEMSGRSALKAFLQKNWLAATFGSCTPRMWHAFMSTLECVNDVKDVEKYYRCFSEEVYLYNYGESSSGNDATGDETQKWSVSGEDAAGCYGDSRSSGL